jgi:hypothetical protein
MLAIDTSAPSGRHPVAPCESATVGDDQTDDPEASCSACSFFCLESSDLCSPVYQRLSLDGVLACRHSPRAVSDSERKTATSAPAPPASSPMSLQFNLYKLGSAVLQIAPAVMQAPFWGRIIKPDQFFRHTAAASLKRPRASSVPSQPPLHPAVGATSAQRSVMKPVPLRGKFERVLGPSAGAGSHLAPTSHLSGSVPLRVAVPLAAAGVSMPANSRPLGASAVNQSQSTSADGTMRADLPTPGSSPGGQSQDWAACLPMCPSPGTGLYKCPCGKPSALLCVVASAHACTCGRGVGPR